MAVVQYERDRWSGPPGRAAAEVNIADFTENVDLDG
jgi:hypothetical protein